MKELPKKIKIAGHGYNITFNEEEDAGTCHLHKQSININPQQHPEQMKTTLLHEIIEAINGHYELNLEHHKICTLETALYQVLHDNRIKW